MKSNSYSWISLLVILLFVVHEKGISQAALGNNSPVTSSHEVSAERTITLRIYAPGADSVSLTTDDIPGMTGTTSLEHQGEGIWEIESGVVPAGAYRYRFNVDGVTVQDPRNMSVSEANDELWSLVVVPGNELMDTRDVPHGAVSDVHYYSDTLDRTRRMHVYTPPDYESGSEAYPVFYLLHGAFGSDDDWSSVGRAGFILDNLIAEGLAEPMIVVMPHGHTRSTSRGFSGESNEFVSDFLNDIKPYVESHYRIESGRENRAIAGLSMGGGHTLSISIPNLDEYAYIGVFSSGLFGINNVEEGELTSFEQQNMEMLEDDSLKDGLELFWFATGEDDFLLETSRATVDLFRGYGFDVDFQETGGGHTWLNWRDYLVEFTPMLFK